MVGVQAKGQGSGAEVGADGGAAVQDCSDETRVKGAGMKWWRGLGLGVCEAVYINAVRDRPSRIRYEYRVKGSPANSPPVDRAGEGM